MGIEPDEGPVTGGNFGPYRQSERKTIYQSHTKHLLENGHAYYAFDTPEELEKMRLNLKEKGVHTPKYDATVRRHMKNSLSMTPDEVDEYLEKGAPYTVRLKVPENQTVIVQDLIRGTVKFDTKELDDKIIMKNRSLPTYHLANVCG